MKTLSKLAAFTGLLALGSFAASAQAGQSGNFTGNFTVSQNGHAVGTASYQFTPSATGYTSEALVQVSMQGLNYALSKTEQLDRSWHLKHVMLSGTVNSSAVSITAKPDATQFLMNISANGRSSTSRLALHPASVFLPDFDPGALQTLLTLSLEQNGHDLWAIVPKQAGSVTQIAVTTDPDEQGTFESKPVTVHHITITIGTSKEELFSGPHNGLLQAELPMDGFALVRKNFVLTPPKKSGAAPTPPPDVQQQQQQQAPGQAPQQVPQQGQPQQY